MWFDALLHVRCIFHGYCHWCYHHRCYFPYGSHLLKKISKLSYICIHRVNKLWCDFSDILNLQMWTFL